jgi:hypothetical protein
VVTYQGLAHCLLLPSGFVMGPLLNGGTLADGRSSQMSSTGRDQKKMWVADVVLRRAAKLVPVELPGPELPTDLDSINVPAARQASLRNLELLQTVGCQVPLKGGFWRDLMRACELLDCADRMPPLVSQYRAALQRVGT